LPVRRPTAGGLLAALLLAAAATALGALARAPDERALDDDGRDYLRAAVHLARTGTLSQAPLAAKQPRPDAYREPGFPAWVAAAWRAAGAPPPAGEAAFLAPAGAPARRAARAAQVLALALAALAAGWGARRLGAAPPLAAGVVLAVAASPALHETGARLASEPLAAALVTLTGAALAAAVAAPEGRWPLVVAALAAGLGALVRAAGIVLVPGGALVLALLPAAAAPGARARRALLYLLLAAAPALAWAARNRAVTGHFVLADRGGAVLAVRAELDRQLAREGLPVALLAWTPLDAAHELGARHYPASELGRYRWRSGGNYATLALGRWRRERAAAPDPLAVDGRLARDALAGFAARPLDHLRATVAVAWRGLFAERGPAWTLPLDRPLAGALGLALAAGNLLLLVRRGREPRVWALLAPALALFAFHALATEFLPRFGVPGLPLAWAGALLGYAGAGGGAARGGRAPRAAARAR
jgi:4-amino-4-deoxy-L-arabinose transferase-like glycosyltransferase